MRQWSSNNSSWLRKQLQRRSHGGICWDVHADERLLLLINVVRATYIITQCFFSPLTRFCSLWSSFFFCHQLHESCCSWKLMHVLLRIQVHTQSAGDGCFVQESVLRSSFSEGLLLFRSCLVRKIFQDSPSHRILWYMHGALNIHKNKNYLHSSSVNREMNLLSLITL